MPIIIIIKKHSVKIQWFIIIVFTTHRVTSEYGDQHQFSPNDIHTLSKDYVMRINKMIT